MNIDSKDILNITNARLLNPTLRPCIIESFSYDSRQIQNPSSSLFVAFKGAHLDGHDFIDEVIQKGVENILVSDLSKVKHLENAQANIYLVSDVLKSIQCLSAYNRKQYHGRILAITGSNAKTIVKEWIHQLMPTQSYRSPLSYNSQLGVAISLTKIPEQSKLAIIEAGISQAGEMTRLEEQIKPNELLFTVLGSAHSQSFQNQEEKLKEKLLLATGVEYIYCSSIQADVIDYINNNFADKSIRSWGYKAEDQLQLSSITKSDYGSGIEFDFNDQGYSFELPFIDDISIENVLHALNYTIYQTEDIDELLPRLAMLETIRMRLEILEGLGNCKLINDNYVSDLYGLNRALNFQESHKEKRTKTLILTNISEEIDSDNSILDAISDLLIQQKIKRVLTVGPKFSNLSDRLPDSISFQNFKDVKSLYHLNYHNECILIKGSRNKALDRLIERLESKSYTSRLEINLTAVEHNINYYKSQLNEGTALMAVLKAGAYGSGSVALARLLQEKQVAYILVALIDEGVELRRHGINIPIVVLNPDRISLRKLFDFDLQTEVYSIDLLHEIIDHANYVQKPIRLHLNLDTGMHRLGIMPDEIDTLCRLIQDNPQLIIESLFSHLAGSENPKLDQYTKKQFEKFTSSYQKIEAAFDCRFNKHILNSAGILRFPQYQLQMVRIGLGLHGIDSTNEHQSHLIPAHALISHVLQIKRIQKGESVGYNQNYVASRNMELAIINLGYADGLNRKLSNHNWQLLIRGELAPITGNISMDLTIIDITDIADVQVGDEVLVFGIELPLDEMAAAAGTISYEILTAIPERVKRVYFKE